VQQFGFTNATYREAMHFSYEDDFWCYQNQWRDECVLAVMVPESLYVGLYGDAIGGGAEFDGTLIEDRLCGRRAAYTRRNMATVVPFRRKYAFNHAEPYFAA